MTDTSSLPGFQSLGVAPWILEALAKHKILSPTPIQQQAIAPALQGKDVIGIAQTGTGKTFAFGIPMLQKLAQQKGLGLVLVPTRELAYQVEESLRMFTTAIRIAVIIGGVSMDQQKRMIRNQPHIIVATPGRLKDHMQQKSISLEKVNILVLDEADRMLDMGFWPQIEQILRFVPRERQTLLFSATMPNEIMKLANSQMQIPLRIEVAPQGTTIEAIRQELFIVQKSEKLGLLETILKDYKGSILVFSRTKHGAKKIAQTIRSMGHSAAEIHANRSLSQRREALEGFKMGKYRILVATDIAARGIDVAGIEVVINYDLPDDPSDYVHRIGRTARAGLEGRAISFATGDQRDAVRKIERLIRSTLPLQPTPAGLPVRAPAPEAHFERSDRRPHSGGNRPRSFSGGRHSGNSNSGNRGGGRKFR